MTAADLADPDRLLARGWVREGGWNPPRTEQLVYRQGDYLATATYYAGELAGVTAGPNLGAARPDARGLDFVHQGRRVSLPVAEPELFRALGPPLERTLGAGG